MMSIGVLARDKFSATPRVVGALARAAPDAQLVVVDVGYPAHIVAEVDRRVEVRWLAVAHFANTNAQWNRFVDAAAGDVVVCVENDVRVPTAALTGLVHLLETECDVAVPTVFEEPGGVVHFDPVVSKIERVDGGVRSTLQRRPKGGAPAPSHSRRVAHLEKHCFAMDTSAAQRLGPLDEAMHCRTDIDMSLQCWSRSLTVAVTPDARVSFTRTIDVSVDGDLFAHRWNLEATAAANERLVRKWALCDYKSSVAFAQEMQDWLGRATTLAATGDDGPRARCDQDRDEVAPTSPRGDGL